MEPRDVPPRRGVAPVSRERRLEKSTSDYLQPRGFVGRMGRVHAGRRSAGRRSARPRSSPTAPPSAAWRPVPHYQVTQPNEKARGEISLPRIAQWRGTRASHRAIATTGRNTSGAQRTEACARKGTGVGAPPEGGRTACQEEAAAPDRRSNGGASWAGRYSQSQGQVDRKSRIHWSMNLS